MIRNDDFSGGSSTNHESLNHYSVRVSNSSSDIISYLRPWCGIMYDCAITTQMSRQPLLQCVLRCIYILIKPGGERGKCVAWYAMTNFLQGLQRIMTYRTNTLWAPISSSNTQYPLVDQGVDSYPVGQEQRNCHASHPYSAFWDVFLLVQTRWGAWQLRCTIQNRHIFDRLRWEIIDRTDQVLRWQRHDV